MTLQALIDKVDNSELIRDQIAAILATETASQQVLAAAAAKDPSLWKLRIYSEQANPIEAWLQTPPGDTSPIVNVVLENISFNKDGSNSLDRQRAVAVYTIDCYGYGRTSDDGSTGHNLGDVAALKEAQRVVRLVRNITMAVEYRYLGLGGIVWGRWISDIDIAQGQDAAGGVQNVARARARVSVEFNEFSPEYVLEILEVVAIDVKRAEDGQILVEADYD